MYVLSEKIKIIEIFQMKCSNNVPTMYVLSEKIKIIEIFQMKCSIVTSEKIVCILHGQIFVMSWFHSFCSLFVSHFNFHCVISILIHMQIMCA